MNTTPLVGAKETAGGQFANWDRRNPYPKTAEGKVAYKAAMQAWWERNGFNGRSTTEDLILLMPGTTQAGMRDCYACRCNDHGDIHFPHHSEDCTITPKIPTQERIWHAACGSQNRATRVADQQGHASIQQVGEYNTYQEQTTPAGPDQGNVGELAA